MGTLQKLMCSLYANCKQNRLTDECLAKGGFLTLVRFFSPEGLCLIELVEPGLEVKSSRIR